MKKIYLLLAFFFATANIVSAANKYWVGPTWGSWSNSINWSLTSGGAGGAGLPGATDIVILNNNARVYLNVSPVIYGLETAPGPVNVVIYTSTPVSITINHHLTVTGFSTLKDSTDGNVAFNVNFNAATHAVATITGDWIFEGGTPLISGSGTGASFNAPAGTVVTVNSIPLYPIQGGRIIQKRNTKPIVSTTTSLVFDYNSVFVSDNNSDITIPYATWAADVTAGFSYGAVIQPSSSVRLSGSLGVVHISGTPSYGNLIIDLPAQTTNVDLGIPNGSAIKGSITVSNTNNFIVTLLAPTSPTSLVSVVVGTTSGALGYLTITGATTKVSLARASALAPATTYRLLLQKGYSQSGGNFSLQDYNLASGLSSLEVRNNFLQTGGTFYTNSKSTIGTAKFQLVMADPYFETGPSGLFNSIRNITASSGTIDNGLNMVTLKIDHSVYNLIGQESTPSGVMLLSPLTVGRLDLARSPLTTTATNVLTVTDPRPEAITIGGTGKSYVNGLMKRVTNTTLNYGFPVGKGNSTNTGYQLDSCVVIPSTTDASLYSAEYFKPTPSGTTVAAPLIGVSLTEYWRVSKISGAEARIKLILNAAVPGATASRGLVVAEYVKSMQWVTVNGSVLTPGNTPIGSVTSKAGNYNGYFTFGYGKPGDFLLPFLPIGTLAASVTPSTLNYSQDYSNEIATSPKIFPNPFMNNFTLSYNTADANDKANINLYDLKGRLVYSQQLANRTAGYTNVNIDLAGKNLAEGIYMAELKINGVPAKIVKLMKIK